MTQQRGLHQPGPTLSGAGGTPVHLIMESRQEPSACCSPTESSKETQATRQTNCHSPRQKAGRECQTEGISPHLNTLLNSLIPQPPQCAQRGLPVRQLDNRDREQNQSPAAKGQPVLSTRQPSSGSSAMREWGGQCHPI